MEFDFQKTKPPPFILDQLMNSRHRNPNDMRGPAAIPDFLHQPNFNQQGLIPNPEMEPSHFSGMPDFQPSQTSSQIPQFIFDQESIHSNDESFLPAQNITNRNYDSDKHTNSKKYNQPMDTFFESCADSPTNAPSPSSDFQVPSRFNQQSFPFQNKIPSIDKGNNRHQQLQEKPATSSDLPLQNNERQVEERTVSNQVQEGSVCSQERKASAKDESLAYFNAELHEFTKSYTKLSTEKVELEKQVTHTEMSLKEYREQALEYKNKYEEVKEKLSEEIKNREGILAQVEYVNSVSQLLDKHFKDICNTLKLYGNINNEYKEHNSKLRDHVENEVKEYESVLSSYKITIEKLKSQMLIMEKNFQETTAELLNTKEQLVQQIDEANIKLGVEQNRSKSLEENLFATEQLNKELVQKQEQSENSFSEKFSSLEMKFEENKNKLEAIQNENAELKVFEIKYKQLETFVEKLQQEKEALSNFLDTSQQNLSKSESERTEHLKFIERLCQERETANEAMSKLKDECADLNLKLKEGNVRYEHLFSEIEILKGKYQSVCNDVERYKVDKLTLEDEIKKTKVHAELTENINLEMKAQLNAMHKELEASKAEIVSKAEQILSLEGKHSLLESENEELKVIEEELREDIVAKEQKIDNMVTLNSSLEVDLNKQDETNKQLQEELLKAKNDMANTRQEMLTSVDQYREQFMNELKENEDSRKKLQCKYETTCSELEKMMENKKQCDVEISDLQLSIRRYESKIKEMDTAMKTLKQDQETKESEFCERITKLKNIVSKLEEEKMTLEKSLYDLKSDSNLRQILQEKIVSLEKQIDFTKQENQELREKLKTGEKSPAKERTTYSETDTLKFPGVIPAPKRRVCFDEDFLSDGSSIDLSKLFNKNADTPKSQVMASNTYNEKEDKPKKRQGQRNTKNSGKKFFKKSFPDYDDTNIFG